MNKNKKGMIDYGILGLLTITSSTLIAVSTFDVSKVDSVAKTVVNVADKNPLLACIYIMALCLIAVSILCWNVFKTGIVQHLITPIQ